MERKEMRDKYDKYRDFSSVREDVASTEIMVEDGNEDDLIDSLVLHTYDGHYYDMDDFPSCVASCSSSNRHKPLEEAPHNPLEEIPHNPLEEAPHNPLEEAPHNPLEESPHNPLEEAPYYPLEEAPYNPLEAAPRNPSEEAPQDGNDYQSTSIPLPLLMDRISGSNEDDERIVMDILKWTTNTEMPHYKFYVRENKALRKIHMKTAHNMLFVEQNCVIFIEVEGAQAGHVVTVELRYMAGAHANVPVIVCGKHADSTDPQYSFCVPKLSSVHKVMDQNGHLSLKIPVPSPPAENGNSFTFPLMFRCWNYCHVEHKRDQEIILKLCDQQNNVLKETHINLQVCSQVKRDFNKWLSQRSKRSSEEETKGSAVKKIKQGVQERGEGMQAGEAETPVPPTLLPPHQDERLCVRQVKCDPASLPALKDSIKKLRQEGHNIEME